MQLSRIQTRALNYLKNIFDEKQYRKIAIKYNFNGYKRFYFYHIRKAGGTSVNYMFLSLSGEDYEVTYNRLSEAPRHRIVINDKIYAGWNTRHINTGNYFYAFSHIPYYQLAIPDNTFSFTCFRDPVSRVISHYNMLREYRLNNTQHICMKTEGKWLGETFDEFVENMPKNHLINQVYMFSENYDIDEAVECVKRLSFYFFLEKLEEGIKHINIKTGLKLNALHSRKSNYSEDISAGSRKKLRELLDIEYTFLQRINSVK